ncbi:MAG: c-type cytochrome [Gammaproteobacteria bacterium]
MNRYGTGMHEGFHLRTSAILLIAIVSACDSGDNGQDLQLPALGFVPASVQRSGDPQAGYDALVNEPYISCGVPYTAYRKNSNPPMPEELLPGRNALNRDLPYNVTSHVTRNNVRLVSSNCLICHAGFFNKKLIIGLGNEFLDFTRDASINAEQVGAYIEDEEEAREWKKWADRIAAIAPYSRTETVGMNPAVNVSFTLMAHRDPKTLAWSQEALMEPPTKTPLPLSVPPWWRMKKKHALFYNTEGRGDHARLMMLAETLCVDSVEEARRIDRFAGDLLAFLESLDAPRYPFVINDGLAAEGATLFKQNCTGCHGTYGADSSYPNLVFDYAEIGTDPELAKFFTSAENVRFVHWFNQSFYGENSRGEPAPGYIAPPLDGIWATAPFFHNGSVPTIEGVLNSRSRPRFWLYPEKPEDFNEDTLGWNHRVLDYGKQGTEDPRERKRIYDTTVTGYSNSGHTYGDHLKPEERRALIEYIKTL